MFLMFACRDLSNNHIGGSIPSSLPVTMQTLYVLISLQNYDFMPDTNDYLENTDYISCLLCTPPYA